MLYAMLSSQLFFSCEGAAQHVHLSSVCVSVRLWTKLNFCLCPCPFLPPFCPLFTPLYPFIPLYTPLYPFIPLYAPLCPFYAPSCPFTPLYTSLQDITCFYTLYKLSSSQDLVIGLVFIFKPSPNKVNKQISHIPSQNQPECSIIWTFFWPK